ncbi:hypothetical protein ICN48_13100 [Polynucleobacter sp. JS-Safj-400b-B2]|uniref:hypothetical protein n=1 Tax=Polynucleobacter sp. JS-Safj-400b-B2 TaxID=2576921 RepID=UPI001C0ADE71|nr:hypothetical protein [Polynucleobacter sp. JS-Safj-400b-B2]MBU3627162.1 hypothetical protein [Polynucleobacter sp. JS-Safj-400b-B2]
MARRSRYAHSCPLTAKVASEAVAGDKILAQIAQKYDAHPNQITEWKRQLIERVVDVFVG